MSAILAAAERMLPKIQPIAQLLFQFITRLVSLAFATYLILSVQELFRRISLPASTPAPLTTDIANGDVPRSPSKLVTSPATQTSTSKTPDDRASGEPSVALFAPQLVDEPSSSIQPRPRPQRPIPPHAAQKTLSRRFSEAEASQRHSLTFPPPKPVPSHTPLPTFRQFRSSSLSSHTSLPSLRRSEILGGSNERPSPFTLASGTPTGTKHSVTSPSPRRPRRDHTRTHNRQGSIDALTSPSSLAWNNVFPSLNRLQYTQPVPYIPPSSRSTVPVAPIQKPMNVPQDIPQIHLSAPQYLRNPSIQPPIPPEEWDYRNIEMKDVAESAEFENTPPTSRSMWRERPPSSIMDVDEPEEYWDSDDSDDDSPMAALDDGVSPLEIKFRKLSYDDDDISMDLADTPTTTRPPSPIEMSSEKASEQDEHDADGSEDGTNSANGSDKGDDENDEEQGEEVDVTAADEEADESPKSPAQPDRDAAASPPLPSDDPFPDDSEDEAAADDNTASARADALRAKLIRIFKAISQREPEPEPSPLTATMEDPQSLIAAIEDREEMAGGITPVASSSQTVWVYPNTASSHSGAELVELPMTAPLPDSAASLSSSPPQATGPGVTRWMYRRFLRKSRTAPTTPLPHRQTSRTYSHSHDDLPFRLASSSSVSNAVGPTLPLALPVPRFTLAAPDVPSPWASSLPPCLDKDPKKLWAEDLEAANQVAEETIKRMKETREREMRRAWGIRRIKAAAGTSTVESVKRTSASPPRV